MWLRDLFAYCSEAFICIETIRYLVTQLSFFFLLYSVVWRKEWCFACPSSGSHPFFWLVYLVTFEVLNLGLANTSQKVRCGRVALLMNIVVILGCGVFKWDWNFVEFKHAASFALINYCPVHLIFSSFGFSWIDTKKPKYQPSSLFTFFSTPLNQF